MPVSRRLALMGLALGAVLPNAALAQSRGDRRRRRTGPPTATPAPSQTVAFAPIRFRPMTSTPTGAQDRS